MEVPNASESSAGELSDQVEAGDPHRSEVKFGEVAALNMGPPIWQVYLEGVNGAAPDIHLLYSVKYPGEIFLDVVVPYEGGDIRAQIPQSQASVSVARGAHRLRSAAGEVNVLRTGEHVRLELSRLAFIGDSGDLDAAAFADGVIQGDLDRYCQALVIDPAAPRENGTIVPQHRTDEEWSSAFCAQFR